MMQTRTINTIVFTPKPKLPNEVLLELLGNFSFSKDQEKDMKIAEEIASRTFYDLEDALGTIRAMGARISTLTMNVLKEHEFYKPYWRTPPRRTRARI